MVCGWQADLLTHSSKFDGLETWEQVEREFFIDNLLVRIHRCFWCTGLAPWEFESPFPGSLISTFLGSRYCLFFSFFVHNSTAWICKTQKSTRIKMGPR